MSQINALVGTLKRVLRSHGLTYRDVAASLDMSEVSVKRMFSSRRAAMTLQRLESVCRLVDLDLTDLVAHYEQSKQHISALTLAQEEHLVADRSLLLVALLVRNGWGFADILGAYRFSASECVHLLAQLDRLGLIELQPGNRIRLRISRDFRWLSNGPIERFFEHEVQTEFLHSRFDADGEMRLYLSGALTAQSIERVQHSLRRVAAEFADAQLGDSTRPPAQRQNIGLLLAMRPWYLSAFDTYRREPRPPTT